MKNSDTVYEHLKLYAKILFYLSLILSVLLLVFVTVSAVNTIPALLYYTHRITIKRIPLIIMAGLAFLLLMGISFAINYYFYLWLIMKIEFYEDIHSQTVVLGNISNIMIGDSNWRKSVYASKK